MSGLELSVAEVRMLALQALGLRGGIERKLGPLGVLDHLSLLQMDSVNVFERAHYLPVFSRIGRYDREKLTDLMSMRAPGQAPSPVIEYWAHEASLIRVEDLPLYRWRMDALHSVSRYERWSAFAKENRPLLEWIKGEIGERGPLSVGELEHERNARKGSWWGWSDVKNALEWMFMAGEVVSGGRKGFTRTYALPEQILSNSVREALAAAGTPEQHAAARKTLLLRAADALGPANLSELSDYHRQGQTTARPFLKELVEAGDLTEARVAGWKDPVYLSRQVLASVTEATSGTNPTTILSPFDPLTWNRDRALRMFDFDYRIEIYTPKPKRIYGYYTLPILHNRKIVGRIDLKSDRQANTLRVQAAWAEPWLTDAQVRSAATSLYKHLLEVQKWQGLDQLVIEPIGTFSEALRSRHQSSADA